MAGGPKKELTLFSFRGSMRIMYSVRYSVHSVDRQIATKHLLGKGIRQTYGILVRLEHSVD